MHDGKSYTAKIITGYSWVIHIHSRSIPFVFPHGDVLRIYYALSGSVPRFSATQPLTPVSVNDPMKKTAHTTRRTHQKAAGRAEAFTHIRTWVKPQNAPQRSVARGFYRNTGF